jgi:extradiol dioxygenase family protein
MDIRTLRIALQVRDMEEAREFYREVLGCLPGRSDGSSVDFVLYGHQITCHLDSQPTARGVPNTHWGVQLTAAEWGAIVERLKRHGVGFVIEPRLACFERAPGERASLHFLDPCGNAFEFKSMRTLAGHGWPEDPWKATGAKTLCFILATAALCWMLLQARKSTDEVNQSYFPAQLPPACAVASSCVP